MTEFLQPIVNGVLLGGVYAGVAVGLSLIFGIVRIVNLAHGDLVIVASYLGFVAAGYLGLVPLTVLVLVVPGMFLVGYLFQKCLLNRTRGKGMEPPLIVAFGASVIVQNLLLLVFSPDARSLAGEFAISRLSIGPGVHIPVVTLIGFVLGTGVVLGLDQFLRRTYLGLAIRAASDDEQAATFVGIDTPRVHCHAMGIAAATAAVSGIVIGMMFTFQPYSGPQYLITAFGVAVLGGLGNVRGTLAGGIVLGLSQMLGAHLLGPGLFLLSGYLVVLAILILRPEGIIRRSP